ncbi:uncharacterized protein BCR38DRAFT_338931 [Pseudomassariella vexata]|uniref:Ribosomal protein L9 domain-containing protein n=1 Tax=Pseudomassariella vexata TaxID=1141098 RepID=A0A1Y2E5H1_9PEZI|nr:uncharacterized protein BCR38DRAFT_338931 [Pseudomassariella vexata]ORY66115.1 hypothetical protein BCR38DRAFT_338931 [Pseudomassariella vexata]
MVTPRLTRTPTCLSCLHRIANPRSAVPSPLSLGQVRYARTLTKAEEEDLQGIPVRLLRDITGFGRQNAIIRVKPGRMRNIWHHKGLAEYMTKKRFEELGLTQAAIGVRDRTFGTQLVVEEDQNGSGKVLVEEGPKTKKKEALTLAKLTEHHSQPEEAHTLLSQLLPDVLTFARKPIATTIETSPSSSPSSSANSSTPAPEPEIRRSPSLAANAAVSHQQQAQKAAQPSVEHPAVSDLAAPPSVMAIFGSVSVVDILAAIKDALQADQNGNRVALEAHGIRILGLEDGEDRIKRLGRFDVEIETGKGMVRRSVEVVAED